MDIVIERLGNRLTTYVDGEAVGQLTVPQLDHASGQDDPHEPLTGIFVACSHCDGRIETIKIEVPSHRPEVIDRAACSNLLRNGSFGPSTDAVPDGWAIDYKSLVAGPCCAA